jgi:Sigma-54 interaction domain
VPLLPRQGRRHAGNNHNRDDVLAVSRVRQDVDDPSPRPRSRTLAVILARYFFTLVAVRLMAGTTVSLRERIADGAFSERLFYRLNIIHVTKGVRTRRNSAQEQRGRPA